MKMRNIFFCAVTALLIGVGLIVTPSAFAQDPNRLTQLKVSVWPEYDRPTVLVILEGTLADKTNLPRDVSILIPSKADLLVTTYENADGTLAPEQTSQATPLGDGFTRVTFTTKTTVYRVEYYDDLIKGAPDKTIDFTFKSSVPADQVMLEIQQPLKATDFSVNLPVISNRTDADGFKYFAYLVSNANAGQTISAQIKYTKTEPGPSVRALTQAAPATTPAPAPVAAPSMWQNVFLIVALVVLGLVAVFGFFLLQKRSRETYPAARPMSRKPARGGQRVERSAPANASAFCTQCGRALSAEDNFCPRCGTRRRTV